MSVWFWILLGTIVFLTVSLLVGLAVAAILANIGREVSALIESEPPESTPGPDDALLSEILEEPPARSGGLRLR